MYRSIIAATLAAATLAAPAFAATDTFKLDVDFSRANLVTEEGASAEYSKIRDQVADRCIAEHAGMRSAKAFAVEACTNRTLSKAVRRIANPVLTSVHLEARG
jgi:UrcA family protein